MDERGAVANWPIVKADIEAGTIVVNGTPELIREGDPTVGVIDRTAELANTFHRPIRVSLATPEGDQVLVVDESGGVEVEALPEPAPRRRGRKGQVPAAPAKQGVTPRLAMPEWLAKPHRPAAADRLAVADRLAEPDPPAAPYRPASAASAWDEALTVPKRVRGANSIDALIGRTWTKCHYVAVVNSKGGVGKTIGSVLLASVFGQGSGQGVCLVDNNPTGTLAKRLEVASRDAPTILTVADALAAGAEPSGVWLTGFMQYQPQGRFSALVARDSPVSADSADGQARLVQATLDSDTFDTIMTAAGQSFRIVVADGGNNDADEQQTGAMRWADCLVIATDWTAVSCEGVKTQVQMLRAFGRTDLIRSAILMPTDEPSSPEQKANRTGVLRACKADGIEVCPIPRVPSLVDGPLLLRKQPASVVKAAKRLAGAAALRFAQNEASS